MSTDLIESRIMGLDYGEKRIGVALSDPTKVFSYSFITIANEAGYFSKLAEIVREKNVVKIIIGLPSDKFNSSRLLTEKILQFKSELEKKINVEVLLWNEEYSSAIAQQKILESIPKKSKRRNKGLKDSFSAAVILQEYLDSR